MVVQKNCQGVDKGSIEYQFAPITKQKDILTFKNDSREIFRMNLKSFKSSNPYVEKSCGGYARTSTCRSSLKAIYTY